MERNELQQYAHINTFCIYIKLKPTSVHMIGKSVNRWNYHSGSYIAALVTDTGALQRKNGQTLSRLKKKTNEPVLKDMQAASIQV